MVRNCVKKNMKHWCGRKALETLTDCFEARIVGILYNSTVDYRQLGTKIREDDSLSRSLMSAAPSPTFPT